MFFEVLLSRYGSFVSCWNRTGVELESIFRNARRCYQRDVNTQVAAAVTVACSDTALPLCCMWVYECWEMTSCRSELARAELQNWDSCLYQTE